MGSRIGQILLDTKVLVRLNILVARISLLPSISRETRAIDWPEILIDHQSNHPVKPFADGFQDLPSIALMKLGSSLPPRAETRPLSWMNSIISAWVFSRRLGLSRCSRTRVAFAFLISALVFELEHYPRFWKNVSPYSYQWLRQSGWLRQSKLRPLRSSRSLQDCLFLFRLMLRVRPGL